MKKFIVSMVVGAVVLMAAGQTFAEAEKEKAGKPQQVKECPIEKGENADKANPKGLRRGTKDQKKLKKVSRMITELRTSHKELIAALEAIKAQAGKENAAETVKLVQALIDKKKLAYTEKIVKLEQEQAQLREKVTTKLKAHAEKRREKKLLKAKEEEQSKPESKEEK